MNNTGCYECKKCKARFKVLSLSHHRALCYPKKTKTCPHCQSTNIKMITIVKFKEYDRHIWYNAKRKGIDFSIKF